MGNEKNPRLQAGAGVRGEVPTVEQKTSAQQIKKSLDLRQIHS
jgi:hypothetical protein